MRIAAIDVGTNTAQLLVAEVENGTIVRRICTDERFVRLGEGVDAGGQISASAVERLINALRAQRQMAEAHGAGPIIVGATSASRDAANQQEVIDAVHRETGLSYEILSGAEEATWTFMAACDEHPARTGPTVVIDIGGGSTEIVIGQGGAAGPSAVQHRYSVNIGSVRLSERFFETLPPSNVAVQKASDCIDASLPAVNWPDIREAMLIGTSGTTEALALVHAGPSSTMDTLDDASRTLSADAVHRWSAELLGCSVAAIKTLHPESMHGRADVFPMGVLILERFMRATGLGTCHVSAFQLQHGLVLRWLHQSGAAAS